jgi:hypothetical protein
MLVEGLMAFVNHFTCLSINDSFTVPIAEADAPRELFYDCECTWFSALRHGSHKKSIKPCLLPSKVWLLRFPFDRNRLILADT